MIVRRYYRGIVAGMPQPRRHPLAIHSESVRGVRHVGLAKIEQELLRKEEEAQAGNNYMYVGSSKGYGRSS